MRIRSRSSSSLKIQFGDPDDDDHVDDADDDNDDEGGGDQGENQWPIIFVPAWISQMTYVAVLGKTVRFKPKRNYSCLNSNRRFFRF